MRRRWPFLVVVAAVSAALFALPLRGQNVSSGKLQIHYMDVGQGDGAVLISPGGEVVLFDDGVVNQCGKPLAYLQSLGITKIDYHIASHYHSDHIGCATDVLNLFPLQKTAYDRGASYSTSTYAKYVTAVGSKRQTAAVGTKITLDAGTANPVTIEFVAVNGNGRFPTPVATVAVVMRAKNIMQIKSWGGMSGYAGAQAVPTSRLLPLRLLDRTG